MTSLRSPSAIFSAGTLVRLLPALGVLAVWTALMPAAGGFDPRDWYPAGLVLLGLLTVAVVGGRTVLPPGRWTRTALLAFAAFTALNLLSIAWSDAPGNAWETSNLLLVALLGAWVISLAPWRTASADVLLGGFALCAAVICGVTLLASLDVADLTSRFTDARYNQPLDYPNSTAGFAFLAAVPALVMASRPDLPLVVKVLAQGTTSLLVTCALLPQSRGSVLGTTVTLLFLLVLVPFRWRLALHAAAAGLVMAIASGPIFDVYDAANANGVVSPALSDAARAIWISTAAGLALGLALALGERRVKLGDRGRRAARLGGWGAWGAAALAVLVLAATHAGQIRETVSDEWNSLKNPGIAFGGGAANEPASGNRLASVDPLQRYDYWRVAVGGFRERPLVGTGAGGFEHRYGEDRRYEKLSKYPHNLTVRILGETGILGFALFALFAGALLFALLARWRDAGLAERGVVAAALGAAVYFFVHAQFDWLEAYPVLAGPALALPFAAARARQASVADEPAVARRTQIPRAAAIAAGAVALLAAGASLVAPWLAVRWTDRAVVTWKTDPAAAFRDLERAADANPAAVTPLLYAGIIAIQRNELDRAEGFLVRALDREDNWLVHYELAAVAAGRGDRGAATRQLQLARLKNVRDRRITSAQEEIDKGKRIAAAEFNGRLFELPLFNTRRLS